MPTPLIQSYARKAKKTVAEVEAIWDKAKEKAKAIRNSDAKDPAFWRLVNGITKKELGLNEAVTFNEFLKTFRV